MVFTMTGWIGSLELAGARGLTLAVGVGSGRDETRALAGAAGKGSGWRSVASDRSATRGAVFRKAACLIWLLINSRMRASRAKAEWPPRTTATRYRPSR